jgi:glycosyltransferase involved in cell wall biosynthesis
MFRTKRKIWVALPAMDELEYLPAFMSCLREQSFKDFKLVVNVNQPDEWWSDPNKREICENNLLSLEFLRSQTEISSQIIDSSSPGNGMKGNKTGVGWARKTPMDWISEQADDRDIIISLDADTTFEPEYFKSVLDVFNKNPQLISVSIPYYHHLTGDEEKDRAILHYEIYMRYYAINLWRIESHYSFTAVGSAIALPVHAYRAIGGITPHKSGEDFYFLLKLRKYGEVGTWMPEKVYPAARYSNRVGFGTGPAMIKGRAGEWSSYPIYPFHFFDDFKSTVELFPVLFEKEIGTPMDDFITEKFGERSIWKPLRDNFKTPDNFIRACHHKMDAFRILQYLKWRNAGVNDSDEHQLIVFIERFYPSLIEEMPFDFKHISFKDSPVSDLNHVRDLLADVEADCQIKYYSNK